MDSPELAPLAVDSPRTTRLVQAIEKEARDEHRDDFLVHLRVCVERVTNGRASGAVLVRSGGSPGGLAVWQPVSTIGREVTLLYLDPSHRSREDWGGFLDAIQHDSSDSGPVVFCVSSLPGLSEVEETSIFRARGYSRFSRYEMKYPLSSEIPLETKSSPGTRNVVPGDEPALALLHQRCYEHHLDRYLSTTREDPKQDSEEHLRGIFRGDTGNLESRASFVEDSMHGLAGATLVTLWGEGPLLIQVMTDPACRGRGIATRLIFRSLQALRSRGQEPLRLNVTGHNSTALRLYRRLGFVTTLGPEYTWCDFGRLGLPEAEEDAAD